MPFTDPELVRIYEACDRLPETRWKSHLGTGSWARMRQQSALAPGRKIRATAEISHREPTARAYSVSSREGVRCCFGDRGIIIHAAGGRVAFPSSTPSHSEIRSNAEPTAWPRRVRACLRVRAAIPTPAAGRPGEPCPSCPASSGTPPAIPGTELRTGIPPLLLPGDVPALPHAKPTGTPASRRSNALSRPSPGCGTAVAGFSGFSLGLESAAVGVS
jgi:hypothetical protein